MIICIPSHLNPLSISIPLSIPLWPEYVVHDLDHPQLTIKPHSHRAVTDSGASPIHNELVDAVEAENGEDIPCLEVTLIVVVV
jgi:hypothetical protein